MCWIIKIGGLRCWKHSVTLKVARLVLRLVVQGSYVNLFLLSFSPDLFKPFHLVLPIYIFTSLVPKNLSFSHTIPSTIPFSKPPTPQLLIYLSIRPHVPPRTPHTPQPWDPISIHTLKTPTLSPDPTHPKPYITYPNVILNIPHTPWIQLIPRPNTPHDPYTTWSYTPQPLGSIYTLAPYTLYPHVLHLIPPHPYIKKLKQSKQCNMLKTNYSRRWLLHFMLYKISQDNVLILALRPNRLLTNLYKECEGPWA